MRKVLFIYSFSVAFCTGITKKVMEWNDERWHGESLHGTLIRIWQPPKSLEKLKGPTWQVTRGVEGVNLDNGGRCQGVPPGRLATLWELLEL